MITTRWKRSGMILKTVFATLWTLASRMRWQLQDTTYLGSIACFDDNPGRNKDYITRQRKHDLYITGTSFLAPGNACTRIVSLQGRSISVATLVRQSKTTQNVFWSYVKRLKQENPRIADFEVDGKVISDGGLTSEILNSQFSSVFTKEDLENIPEMGSDPTPGLESLIISEQGVLKQLSSLNPNKACGPDQIPPWFLKTFASDIAPILTDIFQDSIDSGTVPHGRRLMCVQFLKRERNLSQPTIDLYLLRVLHRRSSSISSTALFWNIQTTITS